MNGVRNPQPRPPWYATEYKRGQRFVHANAAARTIRYSVKRNVDVRGANDACPPLEPAQSALLVRRNVPVQRLAKRFIGNKNLVLSTTTMSSASHSCRCRT